jgi:predicted DNA-binding transcriptional regulator AlpA
MEPEIIHIPELALMLGRSESAIRSARQAGAAWLPPSFMQGSRVCWRVSTVRQFLQEYESGLHVSRRPGRKRQTPPTITGGK